MKKLITICLLVATTFSVNAQTKPTKEETLAFLRRTCESTIGKTSDDKKFIKTTFSYNNITTEYLYMGYEDSSIDEFSLIKWENATEILMWEHSTGDEQEISDVMIKFSSQVLLEQNGGTGEYRDSVYFYYPEIKRESVKKAIERLIEIAKEENKDPFQD